MLRCFYLTTKKLFVSISWQISKNCCYDAVTFLLKIRLYYCSMHFSAVKIPKSSATLIKRLFSSSFWAFQVNVSKKSWSTPCTIFHKFRRLHETSKDCHLLLMTFVGKSRLVLEFWFILTQYVVWQDYSCNIHVVVNNELMWFLYKVDKLSAKAGMHIRLPSALHNCCHYLSRQGR